MQYEIRPATLRDALRLARVLRAEDRAEIEGKGADPRRLLSHLWHDSVFSRVAFVDEEIAAVWGLVGTLIGSDGRPWLFTAPAIEQAPLAFYREARGEIGAMMATRTRLETSVMLRYTRSVRMWKLLGFHLGDVEEVGPTGERYRSLVMERA